MTTAPVDRATELAERRARLRAQCAMERRQLGEQAETIERELDGIDRSVAIVRSFISKPALVAAGVAALTLIGPARALRWAMQGTLWWSTGKRLLGAYAALRASRLAPVTRDS